MKEKSVLMIIFKGINKSEENKWSYFTCIEEHTKNKVCSKKVLFICSYEK